MSDEINRLEGPTQWRELAIAGELPAAYNPTAAAPQVSQVGVDVSAALAAASVDSDVVSHEDSMALLSLIQETESAGDADLDSVKKATLEALVDMWNDSRDEADHLAKSGTKAELFERLHDALHV